jgi:hypothetical protein
MRTLVRELKRNTLQSMGSEPQTAMGRVSKQNRYLSALGSLVIFGVLSMAGTAKASVLVLNNVSITSSASVDCVGLTGGVLDLSSTGTATLDFPPGSFGSTESCGARLDGGTVPAFTGTTLTLLTNLDYPASAICSGASCNGETTAFTPVPPFDDYVRLIFTSQTTGIIEDGGFTEPSGAVAGGSFILDFSFNAPNGGGVPEPSTFALIGSGLVIAGLISMRSRKRPGLAPVSKDGPAVNS